MSNKKVGAKDDVLKKWPDAYAYQWSGPKPWSVYADPDGPHRGLSLAVGHATARQAWQSAAANIRSRKK